MTLWILHPHIGKYVITRSTTGEVLLGPFYSHTDAKVVAQRLADVVRRPVYLSIEGQVAGPVLSFAPGNTGAIAHSSATFPDSSRPRLAGIATTT